MIFSSLQTRYILSSLLNKLFILLLLFYLGYILFDLSIHFSDIYQSDQARFSSVLLFYFYNLIKRLDLLVPLSLMIATIHTLTTLNMHNELLALRTTGRTLKRIVKPIVMTSLVCSSIILLCYEFLLPHAQSYIDDFHAQALNRSHQKKPMIHTMTYDNGAKLIYSQSSPAKKTLYDAYFILRNGDLWHFKRLKEEEGEIKGYYVDTFKRVEEGHLVKDASYVSLAVPFIPFPLFHIADQQQEPYENLSISTLLGKILRPYQKTSREFHEIATQLYFKLSMPWFSFLLTLAIIPFCVVFSRLHRPYLLYTLSLLGFVSFFTIMDASVILGENNIVSPALAGFGPILGLLLLFGIRFIKLR